MVTERLKAFPGLFRLEYSEGPGLVYSLHAKP